jgi:hypothetical protein
LYVDDVSPLAHSPPDTKSRRIHIQKANPLTALAAFAIYADGSQKFGLSRGDEVRAHADGRRILKILHIAGGLRDRSLSEVVLQML